MLPAIAAGILAALLAALPPWLQSRVPEVYWPVMIPGAAAFAMLAQRFFLDRSPGGRAYDGLADLFIHIQSPSRPDSALKWFVRGTNSFLLALCGGEAGSEGAVIEWGQAWALAIRPRSARWFERRRRTDAATAVAAGLSAALGAPFAGFLLSVELGLGGRSIAVAVGALVAFVVGRGLKAELGLSLPDFVGAVSGIRASDPRVWACAIVMGALGGAAAAAVGRFFRYSQDSLRDLFQTTAWMRTLCAGVLLFLVVLAYRADHLPASRLFEQTVWARHSLSQSWGLFFASTLSLSMVLAGFGTAGVFWPMLALGGYFGSGVGEAIAPWIQLPAALTGFTGAVAFWSAIFGAPVSAAVLVLELTQNIDLLLPCLAAGGVATTVRRLLKTRPLVQADLQARGMAQAEGRSTAVLSAIAVRDAMVADHEIVHEQEPISEIYPRLLSSKYPFLPVVNSQNVYVGLLTVDLIQEAWRSQSEHSNSPLSRLLEAKDLLYRGGFRGPTIKVDDRLSAAEGVFDSVPCVPVLSDEGRVMGLLFIHNVRLAYDREMARRSLVE